jgi:NADPH:quinone reductase-like Zn-dependent oxidoreductase
MRAVEIPKYGPPEVLRVVEKPDPVLGPGQVLVDVAAAGVNFADTMARVGLYADAPKPPMVVGYEVAGTIAAVGDGVDAARVGQRVMAGTQFGGYASRVVVPERDAIPLPDRLSFEEGAAIPVNYATAWAGLLRYGSLQAGEKVLIQAPRAASAPRRPSSPSTSRPRSGAPPRRASTTLAATTASTTRSTTPATAGGRACRPST